MWGEYGVHVEVNVESMWKVQACAYIALLS